MITLNQEVPSARLMKRPHKRCRFKAVTLATVLILAVSSAALVYRTGTFKSLKSERPRTNLRISCKNAFSRDIYKPLNCSRVLDGSNSELPVVYVYVHVAVVPGFEAVTLDVIFALHYSGLMRIAEHVEICYVGSSNDQLNSIVAGFVEYTRSGKLLVTNIAKDVNSHELPTVNRVLNRSKEIVRLGSEAHILYMHAKGLNAKTGAYVPKWYWRHTMQHFLLYRHEQCRNLLRHGYDTLGLNPLDGHAKNSGRVNGKSFHYSGNYWWATAHHLARLPLLRIQKSTVWPSEAIASRLQAENLVLSIHPDLCAGVLYEWNATHMYIETEVPNMLSVQNALVRCDLI